MKRIHFQHNFDYPDGTRALAGHDYLADDNRALFVEHIEEWEGEVTDFIPTYDPSCDYNNKTLLLIRAGGFGDLLFMTPSLEALHKKWPQCRILVASKFDCKEVLRGNPYCEIIEYPVDCKYVDQPNTITVPLENIIENNPQAQTIHAVDLFGLWLGVELGNKQCQYYFQAGEQEWATRKFPRTERPRLGIQAKSSCLVRTWPLHSTGNTIRKFSELGWEVFVFGAPLELKLDYHHPNVINCSERAYNFRQSAAIVDSCDVFLGPDSALVHLAGALDVPTIALYGPYPWQLRTAYQPSIKALSGTGRCAPCFHHPIPSDFPPDQICSRVGKCVVLESITVDRVVRELQKAYESNHRTQSRVPAVS